ncbi:MarR family transcriptional regulator [Sebaldella termitidis]|uniref:MarR family transcriptional regulator n=1 Tax=Sebaldella termitidis TaxID=826 RepID=UPI0011C06E81
MEGFLTKFNLTNTQLSILLLLHLNKDSFETPSSISKKLGLSTPTISNVLKTLHKKNIFKNRHRRKIKNLLI